MINSCDDEKDPVSQNILLVSHQWRIVAIVGSLILTIHLWLILTEFQGLTLSTPSRYFIEHISIEGEHVSRGMRQYHKVFFLANIIINTIYVVLQY